MMLSGGLDSCVVLAQAVANARDYREIHTISFNYGQRHVLELEKAKGLAEYYGVRHTIISVPLFSADSVLMTDAEMPKMTYEEIEESEGVSPTYVPFRNGTFLSLAAGYALDKGLDTILAGVHAEDARGWAYPDCTPEFIGAMANAVYVGTYHKVRLLAPLQYMMKKQIVGQGILLGAPFQLTLSCYEGRDPACGVCPTCIGRLEAFKQCGANDPIDYEVRT